MESESISTSSYYNIMSHYMILMHFLMQFFRRLALKISNKRDSRVTEDGRTRKRKKYIYIIGRAKNARQCTAMESAMRYWKCIRYSISREFTTATRSYFTELNAVKRLQGISFLPNWDSISQAWSMVDIPRRSVHSSSTTPVAIPLPVIRSCWNIACYTSDRVPTSPEARFIKTDDWFVRLVSLRKRSESHMRCLRCLIIGNVIDRSDFLDAKLNWFSRIILI